MIEFERCLNILRDEQVEFVVIGGVAGAAHGSTAVTFDLDICYARSAANLERLVRALAPFHPRLRDAPSDHPFKFDLETVRQGLNFTLTTDLGDLDLFGEVAGLGGYEQTRASSISLELYGRPCLLLSLDGLIQSKRASNRPKDKLAVLELEALKELQMLGNAGSEP